MLFTNKINFIAFIIFFLCITHNVLSQQNKITDNNLPMTNNNEKITYTIKEYTGRPTIFQNERPIFPACFFNSTWDDEQVVDQQANIFAKAGIHIHQLEVKLDWDTSNVTPDAIKNENFEILDKRIKAILLMDAKAMFLLRVHLFVPQKWERMHPDDIVRVEDGTKMVSHKVCVSYASKAWRKDVSEALLKLLGNINRQPYKERLMGVILFWGWSGEWNHWNPNWGPKLKPEIYNKLRNSTADYSPVMQKAFQEYLRNKYDNDQQKLRSAWHDENATFETAKVPRQLLLTEPGAAIVHSDNSYVKAWDYVDCYASEVAAGAGHIAKAIKKNFPGILCGLFTGEILYAAIGGSTEIQRSGHLCFDRVVRDENIDFLVTPNFYPSVVMIGGSAGMHLPYSSAQLHNKFLFYEYDQPTFLCKTKKSPAKNWNETVALLTRDFAWAIINGCGIWWWDMDRQRSKQNVWYDDKRFISLFEQFEKIGTKSLKLNRSSISEIAVIVDTESLMRMNSGNVMPRELLMNQMDRLGKMGAPYDLYTIKDLPKIPKYKMYIFLNSFFMDDSTRNIITKKLEKNDSTIVWVCGAGYMSEAGYSIKRMAEMTGLTFKQMGQATQFVTRPVTKSGEAATASWQPFADTYPLYPAFAVEDSDADIIGVDSRLDLGTVILKEMKDWRSVFISTAKLPSDLLRQIATDAGVHIYLQTNDPICVNASYFSIHIASSGTRKINLPQKAIVRDVINSKIICKEKKNFSVSSKNIPMTYIFQVEYSE